MATSDLNVVIRDQYQGRGLDSLGDDLERVQRGAGQAQRGLLPMVATLGDVANIAQRAGRVFKQAFDLAEEGAQIQRTRSHLESLAATVDTTGERIVEGLRAATNGQISMANAAASAAQIISLSLADNEADIIRLGTVVSTLGLDMQQVILTFANNSIMRLDALGLSVDDVRERAARLQAEGLDANKAFDGAVLEALEAKMTLLKGGLDDNAAAVRIFSATIQDVTDKVKIFLADGLTPWMRLLNGEYAAGIQQATVAGIQQADSMAEMARAASQVKGATEDYLDAFNMGVDVNTAKLNEAQDVLKSYGAAVITALRIETVDDFTAAMSELTGLTSQAAARAFRDIYYGITAMDTAASTAEVSARALAAQEADLAEQTRQANEAARASSRAQYEQSSAFAAATASAASYVGISGEALALMAQYPDVIREMNAAMLAQREAARQVQAEFNAGITAYLSGADAANYYTSAFEDLGTITYQYTTIAGGNRQELERLQGVYARTLQDIRDYEAGIKGVALSEDARAKKLDELNQQAANTQAAMVGLGEVTTVSGSAFTAAEFDSQRLASALLEQSVAAGAGTFQIQQLMEATGLYSDEQIRAALNAAAMQEKIEALAGMVAAGTITVDDAIQRLDDFATALSQPFGIYIETGPLSGAISLLDTLIARYQTAAGLAGAIDAGELGGGGSGSSGSGGSGGSGSGGGSQGNTGDTHYAAGGWVAGGRVGRDSVPATLMPGERVLSTTEVSRMGGATAVDAAAGRSGEAQEINIYIANAGSMSLRGQIVSASGVLADQLGVRG